MSRIKALDLEKYFDYIITTDDTSKNKPSVENWEYLLKLSGLRGEDCMMVGDHPEVDLISAKKLGFLTVWNKEHINNDQHYRFVDYEISEIGQLLAILKKLS
jgi:putative hydrolase of the HAD superfamily